MKRLKRLFVVLSLVFLTYNFGLSQDLIIKKTGETIDCKIIKVDEEKISVELKYKGKKVISAIPLDQIADYKYNYKQNHPTQDLVSLKNGSVIKGNIIDQVPNEQITLQTNDGKVFIYKMIEIDKITKETEEINTEEYGGKYSLGIAIGGGGIIGAPLRLYPTPKFILEIGAYYRPVYIGSEFYGGLMLAGGPTFVASKKFNPIKNKIVSNGISLRAGYCFAKATNSIYSINWAREAFKKPNKKKSFVMEFGIGIAKINSYTIEESGPGWYQSTTYSASTSPLIYWKFHWSFYGN